MTARIAGSVRGHRVDAYCSSVVATARTVLGFDAFGCSQVSLLTLLLLVVWFYVDGSRDIADTIRRA